MDNDNEMKNGKATSRFLIQKDDAAFLDELLFGFLRTEESNPSTALMTELSSQWNRKGLRHFFYWRWEREVAEKWRGVIDDSTDGAFKRWAMGGELGPFQKWLVSRSAQWLLYRSRR